MVDGAQVSYFTDEDSDDKIAAIVVRLHKLYDDDEVQFSSGLRYDDSRVERQQK